jgi:hypothetical protein
MDNLAYVSSRLPYLRRLDKMEAENDLLYISRRWNPTSRDLQEIVLCLLPMLVIHRATNASNLLPSSLSLTQRSRSRPAVTVRFLGGHQQKLMRYSPCIQACEPQSSESQPRIPLPWICHCVRLSAW